MSRGDMIVSMITSFKQGDNEGFIRDCQSIIEYEESKKNFRVANLMRKALEEDTKSNKIFPNSFSIAPIETKRIQKNPSSDNELIEFKESQVSLDKIIMSDVIEKLIASLLKQWKNRDTLAEYNLSPQNRLLFHGSPGTGKTFTAYAIANNLNMDIAYIRFDSLVSSYLGKTGSNIKEIFDLASKKPCVLLLDEIDAIGKKRDDQQELGELKRVVISLLQNLDNFPAESLLIACTNHPHLLDNALWRRFDSIIEFDFPKNEDRHKIISLRLKEMNIKVGLDWIEFWCEISNGVSPAVLVQILENGVRKWVVQEKQNLNLFITEEFLNYLDIRNAPDDMLIKIASKLRSQSNLFSFSYLSTILGIPKSTLHKRIKELEE
ncbi:AAA family ATPase [Terribacillus saccharophilus]|uniref:AAA family ATPase n=1 Tax=Terribacillus saccharophilus TaxID=361277 RepID=UPI0037FDBF56